LKFYDYYTIAGNGWIDLHGNMILALFNASLAKSSRPLNCLTRLTLFRAYVAPFVEGAVAPEISNIHLFTD
jgi:hypothetical protein